ncbi:MAG TPA: low temperature requirement protein A [Streptosporangiaceae bacterium]|jgi:low temperature requirement protein LtrA|nr:low temperature requirement protein A [Streptosporangiaceae bacterium]
MTSGEPDDGGQPDGYQPARVTTLELFFDLIFAFTLTQLAVVLESGMTDVASLGRHVLRVLLIFGLLWWMYSGYAWLTNTTSPVRAPERVLLVIGMAGFLIVGLAIPAGFGRDGIALGLGYLLVVIVHSVLYARVNKQILRIAPFNLASALLILGAGFTDGIVTYVLWAAGLVIQALSPLVVRLGGRFEVGPEHFAERHGALIIVAIGESVAAIGIGAIGKPVNAQLILAAVLGLAISVAFWWTYFGSDDDARGERAMRAAPAARRPGLAITAYFYAHIPMLLGIIFVAAGVAKAVSHGLKPSLPAALVLGLGGAAFVGGTAAFRAALQTGPIALRLSATVFALAIIPVGALVAIEAQVGVLVAGGVVGLMIESVIGADPVTRHNGAHEAARQ